MKTNLLAIYIVKRYMFIKILIKEAMEFQIEKTKAAVAILFSSNFCFSYNRALVIYIQ